MWKFCIKLQISTPGFVANTAGFPKQQKNAYIKQIYICTEKSKKSKKKYAPVSILLKLYQKFFNFVCNINLIITLLRYSQNIDVDSG